MQYFTREKKKEKNENFGEERDWIVKKANKKEEGIQAGGRFI